MSRTVPLMRASIAIIFAFVAFVQQAQAIVYQVGTGTTSQTTSGITPYTTVYEDNRIQYLYLASELTAAGASAGNILSVAINITSLDRKSVV